MNPGPTFPPPVAPAAALAEVWRLGGLDPAALAHATLTGVEPVVPSSFAVGTVAQVSIAAAALAAAELWRLRTGQRQRIAVDMRRAALETFGAFSVDGRAPDAWAKISGLYPCGADTTTSGFVRIHANFEHHRDGALKLLGLAPGPPTERAAVEAALQSWTAEDFEQAAADAGLVVAAARTFAEWDAQPPAQAIAGLPLFSIEKIGAAAPRPWPALDPAARPLDGVRVLELTRVLAGPIAGRTLAAYGADVLLINSPNLPNIESIADTSRGKLSAHLDLKQAGGRARLAELVGNAHIFMQGYRPGGIAALGFSPADLARLRPGIVAVSLSAYGHAGPWAGRRGFDSIVQTATGVNIAEAEAFGGAEPRALPMQIQDYATGFLMAFAAQAALHRQAREGGSWHVRVSLAQTGRWLRGLGRVSGGAAVARPKFNGLLQDYPSGFGRLLALPHAAEFSATPCGWMRPSVPPGTNAAEWPSQR